MNDTADKLIRELASKLGTTAEHLWGVLIRQAGITSWTCVIAFTVLLTGLLVWARHAFKDKDSGSFIGWCIVAAVFAIVLLALTPMVVNGFVNPEYAAMRDVLDMVVRRP